MASGKKRSKSGEPSEDGTVGTIQRQKKSVLVVDEGKSLQTEAVDEQMQIYFRLMKSVPMEVKKSDAVKKVRTDLSEMQGISLVNMKSLSFEGNWLDIKEGKLDDYGISNGSTVNVFLDSGFRIKLHIKLSHTGKKMTLDVDMRDTILDIKRRIQNKEGIPVSRQDLIYLGDGLDDDKPIASYNIVHDSVIYALLHPEDGMQIYVSLEQNERTINLKVKKWYTIKDIKNMIESTEGIQTEKQRLYNGKVKLEDCTTLADSNILQEQTLRLITGMIIYVLTMTGKTLTLQVHGYYTIRLICKEIEEHEGLHIDQQVLMFSGRRLHYLEHSLDDWGITEGDTIYLLLRICGC